MKYIIAAFVSFLLIPASFIFPQYLYHRLISLEWMDEMVTGMGCSFLGVILFAAGVAGVVIFLTAYEEKK